MADQPRILAFAGSARTESLNKKLIRVAVKGAQAAGADVTLIDFRDLPMPLYDGDLEDREGLPETARKFKELMIAHQGFLIAAPEYNSSITPLLKNAIDWASRPEDDEAPLVAFRGKAAALMSASPGGLGGLRGLVTVRAILGNIGVLVLPDQVAISKAHDAFDASGILKDGKQQASVEALGGSLTDLLRKISR
jgi:chromate reductase